jgi:hypothetical protein
MSFRICFYNMFVVHRQNGLSSQQPIHFSVFETNLSCFLFNMYFPSKLSA